MDHIYDELTEEFATKERRFAAANPVFISELHKRGIVFNPYHPLINLIGSSKEPEFLEAILSSLSRTPQEYIRSLVRSLGGSTTAYDATLIYRLFDETDDDLLRVDIVHAVVHSNAIGGHEWALQLLRDRSAGRARSTLATLGYCLRDTTGLAPLLMEYYADFPNHAIETLSRIGDEQVLEFMKQQRGMSYSVPPEYLKDYFKRLEQGINRLEKKLARMAKKKKT